MTQLALHMSRSANGVSRRHGEVARSMWQGLWPERALEDVPITHVTNGVHLPTWMGTRCARLLDRHLGEGWLSRAADPHDLGADGGDQRPELWEVRNLQRAAMVAFVRDRSMADRLDRGETHGNTWRRPRGP